MSIKFLAFSDLVGRPNLLEKILKLNLEDFNFLLCLGDLASTKLLMILGKKRALSGAVGKKETIDYKNYYIKNFPEVIEQLKAIKIFLKKLKNKLPIYSVWGNADLIPFIEKTKIDKYIISIHKNPIEIDKDIYLLGYNGRPLYIDEVENPRELDFMGIPFKEGAEFCHAFSEEWIQSELTKMVNNFIGKKIILATHCPPFGILDKVYPKFINWAVKTYGHSAKEGNIGSKGLRKFDEEFKPMLHIFGHIHEAKGIKKINETTFVNVGTMDKEEFVEVEISDSKINVYFKNL